MIGPVLQGTIINRFKKTERKEGNQIYVKSFIKYLRSTLVGLMWNDALQCKKLFASINKKLMEI